MEIKDYITRMKKFYSIFLEYVDNSDNISESFQKFTTFISNYNFVQNSDEFRTLLHIIDKVFNHHKRHSILIYKVHQILQYLSEQIKQTFSNIEIFKIFKKNKFILTYLFKQKIITVNEEIIYLIFSTYKKQECNFFYPEIKPFLNHVGRKGRINLFGYSKYVEYNFGKKRQEGENDSPICELIRKDSIDEFKKFLVEQNLDADDVIPHSIFETNPVFIKNNTSFIEYAVFYGSKKIFDFLKEEVDITPSLLYFAVIGQNIEVIEFLRTIKFEPKEYIYNECFIQSIKSHNNEIAKMFPFKDDEYKNHFFCFYNFEFFPNDFTDNYESVFDLACQYDYVAIVKILLQTKKIMINELLERKAILIHFLVESNFIDF